MRSDILPRVLIISFFCVRLCLASDLYRYFLLFYFFFYPIFPVSFSSLLHPPAVCVVPGSFGVSKLSRFDLFPSGIDPTCSGCPSGGKSRHMLIIYRSLSGIEVRGRWRGSYSPESVHGFVSVIDLCRLCFSFFSFSKLLEFDQR